MSLTSSLLKMQHSLKPSLMTGCWLLLYIEISYYLSDDTFDITMIKKKYAKSGNLQKERRLIVINDEYIIFV